ncbi:hypothetical protein ACF3MZ_14620 [Paenibacillaceae bacterium WGS1546]|uniref:hypothetical protein n=1 Tax=Cohnella sp. WGS1546 TaxID=3366810 RepID=UPI00372D5288
MTDTHSNRPEQLRPDAEERAQAESAAAAGAIPGDDGGAAPPTERSSPLAEVDGRRLLELLQNPAAALKLQPRKEWIYGAIGAAAGVIGFVVWIGLFQAALRQAFNAFGGLGNLFLGGVLGNVSGRGLLISILSLAILVGALTLIGNWRGARKRDWLEALSYYGGTQLLFGAVWVAAGLLAFLSLQLSTLIGAIALLINLLLLVGQAVDLHEVGPERKFLYIVYSVSAYALLLFLVLSLVG